MLEIIIFMKEKLKYFIHCIFKVIAFNKDDYKSKSLIGEKIFTNGIISFLSIVSSNSVINNLFDTFS